MQIIIRGEVKKKQSDIYIFFLFKMTRRILVMVTQVISESE